MEAERAAMEDRVARNLATVRNFRHLEADLREQGIRMKTGVGSGGRQRKLLRRQKQLEQVAERLWQQTLLGQR